MAGACRGFEEGFEDSRMAKKPAVTATCQPLTSPVQVVIVQLQQPYVPSTCIQALSPLDHPFA